VKRRESGRLSSSIEILQRSQYAMHIMINERIYSLESKLSSISAGIGLNVTMRNNVVKDSTTGTAHCTRDVLKLVPATFLYTPCG
jgi:hypothetical protein